MVYRGTLVTDESRDMSLTLAVITSQRDITQMIMGKARYIDIDYYLAKRFSPR